jgi:indolepyruvate ferredoxin oxidoreductase, beta subunit
VIKQDILMTGVGGQGTILASDILGEAALLAGYDIKKTDTLGMAQRGGSVISHIRIGDHVYAPSSLKARLIYSSPLKNWRRSGGAPI